MNSIRNVEQEVVVNAPVDARILVNAGPGTGKTWTLIERVLFLVNTGIEPDSIQILCFSRAAVEEIKRRMRKAVFEGRASILANNVDIRSFDSFASQLIYWVRDSEYSDIGNNCKIELLNYDERIDLFCKTVSNNPQLISQCNHLIVDEVQDLVMNRADMVLRMIKYLPNNCGVTLFGDVCQSIYDYQVKDGLKSTEFYKNIDNLGDFIYYSFEENHRQNSELKVISNEYRSSLLKNNTVQCNNTLSKISNDISNYKTFNIRYFDSESLEEMSKKGKVGILTRSNAQSLVISNLFHKKGIPHSIQRRLRDNYFNGWIAILFNMMRLSAYDQNDFINAFIMIRPNYSDETAKEIWKQISEKSSIHGKIPVKDLLCGIRNNGKHKGIFIDSSDENIVVSTIHRSKGREYDYVLILDDLFSSCEDSLEEHRVKYVALSRAKKEIYKTSLPDVYFRSLDNRRCFTAAKNRKGKLYLRSFEIGRAEDLDSKSFTCIDGVQKYIRQNYTSLIGEEVYLEKSEKTSSNDYVTYNVYLKKNEIMLGWTSRQFNYDLQAAIKNIYKLPWGRELYDYMYPNGFSGIYIMDIASEIGRVQGNEIDVKDYSSMITWNTVLLEGYAKAEY